MKRLVCVLTAFLGFVYSNAQSLKKYPVSNSGCSVYMFCEPANFDVDKSEDSSTVYTSDCEKDGITYGIICIKLLRPIADLTASEDMMIAYLDYLKLNFEIKKAAGYGKGNRLNNNEDTRGIIDYWEDKEKNLWKIKAWTDGKFIGVLYVHSKKELPETKVNVYLESLRFPGM